METSDDLPTRLKRQEKWDHRFLALARTISTWSKDPSTQVGSVIVRPNFTIASLGYNGFPRGFDDSTQRYADRKLKYSFIVHAEANAITAAVGSLVGCTIYTYPLPACAECAKLAIQVGIRRFVAVKPSDELILRWQESFASSDTLIRECGCDQTWYEDSGGFLPTVRNV